MTSNIDVNAAGVIALGSNLPGAFGSSAKVLAHALVRLPEVGVKILAASPLWRSAAWPDPNEPDYLNAVALVEAAMPAPALMEALRRLERDFGPRAARRNAPRVLDLDLIAYGRSVIAAGPLILPHPRAAERRFVIGPLAQIAPEWVHPVNGLTAKALLEIATVGLDAEPL